MNDYACPNCHTYDSINHQEYYYEDEDGDIIVRSWFYTCPHCGVSYWYSEHFKLESTEIEVVTP